MRDWRRAAAEKSVVAAVLGPLLPLVVLGGLIAAGCGCVSPTPKEKKAFGQVCALDDECSSGECAGYGRFCSKGCTYDKDCGSGYVCRSREGRPGEVCSKPQGTPPGESCMTAVECQHGRCLHGVGEQDKPGFCSAFCQGPEDCPAGLKSCDAISDNDVLKMCTPGDAQASPNARLRFTALKDASAKPGPSTPPAPAAPARAPDAGAAARDAGLPEILR